MKKYLLLMSMLAVASGVYAENSARLDETVISTTGFETTVKDEVKNINVITKEDIQKKNYSSVEEILKDSPFIQTSNEGYGVSFDMRGQGSRATARVKILVDGIPVNMMNMLYGTQCAFPVNNIPVDQIEKIEIVPGGGAVLYGNGTSGGFINIVTANKKDTYATVGGSYGSYDNRKMDVGAGVKLTEKLSADINYAGRNSDGYRDREKTQTDNLIGKFNYQLSKNHKFIAKLEKYNENYRRTGSITRDQMNEDRKMAAPDNYRDGKLTKENYLVGYLGKFNDIEVASTAYVETSHDKQLQDVDTSLSTFWTKGKKTGANIKGKYPYAKGDIIVGYDFLREEADSYGNGVMGGNYYDVTKDTNSVYALNRYEITKALQFTAGVRGEFASYDLKSVDKKHKTVTGKPNLDSCSYEGALNYVYSDTGNVYIKYEKTFTSPNATEYFDKEYRELPASGSGSGSTGMPPAMGGSTGSGRPSGMGSGSGMPSGMTGASGSGMPSGMTGGTRPTTMASMPAGMPGGSASTGMPSGMTSSTGTSGRPSGMPAGMPGMGSSSKKAEAYYVINSIKPEKTDTIEIGMKDVFKNVYVSATAYYSQTKDEISRDSSMSPGVGPVWNYKNFGKTERKGVEIYSEQYFDKLTLNQSVTFVDAKIKSGPDRGKEIPYIAKWRGTLGGEYQVTEKMSINAVANLYSKTFNGWHKNKTVKGYKKGYTTVDLSARYAFDNGLTLMAGVNNIFNEKYYLSEDKNSEKRIPGTMPPRYKVTGSYIPAAERNYYVGFKYDI